jgi:DNA-directed RNA polymerase subunit RPC12/RpoP
MRGKICRVNHDGVKCPECGSGDITSRGRNWLCKQCGHYFIKKPRSRINPEERGTCPNPNCGAKRLVKNGGGRMMCAVCGGYIRTFHNEAVPEPLVHQPWEVVLG